MNELIIEAKIENLDTVLEFVSGELETSECSMKLQMQISIAVEEIFVNIARYAYNHDAQESSEQSECPAPKAGGVVIRVAVGNEVAIEFEDRGKPYNPLEKDDPDLVAAVEEREIGGLGIFMVKQIMDAVEYRHQDSKNILLIKKSIV